MAIDPKSLTVDYRTLQAIPFRDRRALLYSSYADQINSALTPGQRANLFPSYYQRDAAAAKSALTGASGMLGGSGAANRERTGAGVGFSDSNTVEGQPEKKGPPAITASEFRAVESNPFLAGYVDKTVRKEKTTTTGGIYKNDNERVKILVNKLLAAGLTRQAALSIAANNMQESGSKLNTTIKGDKNLSNPSVGIAQWREGRFENLKKFAKEQDRDWTDLETQIDFQIHEMKTLKPSRKGRGNIPGKDDDNFITALNAAQSEEEREKILRENYEVGIYDSKNYYAYLNQVQKGVFEETAETAESAPPPDAMTVVQEVASQTASAAELKGTTVMSEKGTEVLVNEKGYALPVTSKMMHEGHGRTSEFGYGRGRLHAGVDLYATNPETGNLVVGDSAFVSAPISGKVTMVRVDRGRAGNYIEIKDKNGISHRFLHTAKTPAINPNTGEPWQVGETIEQGQTVTTITGSGTKFYNKVREFNGDYNAAVAYFDKNGWGDVNKPHLHYETRRDGRLINPAEIFPQLNDKKTTLQFANIEDRNKHLLATGQISQKQYDEAMSKPEAEKIETTTENLKENKVEPEIKKPLSIIDYSRTEDAKRKPEELKISAVETSTTQAQEVVPTQTATTTEEPQSQTTPVKTMAQGGIVPSYGENEIVTRAPTSGEVIQRTKISEYGSEQVKVEPISKMKAEALTPVKNDLDVAPQMNEDQQKPAMQRSSMTASKIPSSPYSNITSEIKKPTATALRAALQIRMGNTAMGDYVA